MAKEFVISLLNSGGGELFAWALVLAWICTLLKLVGDFIEWINKK